MTVSADQAQWIFRTGLNVTEVYLATVAALVVRLEVLRSGGRLPPGVETLFSPIRGPMDTWGAVWGKNNRVYQGRLLRALFTNQHLLIGDSWTTSLVYAARILLVVSLGFFLANVAAVYLR